jgi:hypothetical protein
MVSDIPIKWNIDTIFGLMESIIHYFPITNGLLGPRCHVLVRILDDNEDFYFEEVNF